MFYQVINKTHINDCIRLFVETSDPKHNMMVSIPVYATQSGCTDADEENFYDELRSVVAEIPTSDILILLGDWNGHVDKCGDEYEGVHVGHGWDTRNTEGDREIPGVYRVLQLGHWQHLSLKLSHHLITFISGEGRTQVVYVLRKTIRKNERDFKVMPGEEIARQHHPLVCDFRAGIPLAKSKA